MVEKFDPAAPFGCRTEGMMGFRNTGLVAVSLAALLAAGCSSTRFSSMNEQPAPLQAAPSGNVTSSTALPPPAAPGTAPTDPAGFPEAPGASTQVASVTPGVDPAAASAPDLTTGNVVGAWSASVAGQSCQLITSLTKLGANNRAASRQCAAPMNGVKAWNVAGKQLSLYDESGSVVATLQSSGDGKFNGQTSTGAPISLSR